MAAAAGCPAPLPVSPGLPHRLSSPATGSSIPCAWSHLLALRATGLRPAGRREGPLDDLGRREFSYATTRLSTTYRQPRTDTSHNLLDGRRLLLDSGVARRPPTGAPRCK
ncbi:hypothetical protein MTO96_006810 [Rhipicephalus appendiculatus]